MLIFKYLLHDNYIPGKHLALVHDGEQIYMILPVQNLKSEDWSQI